MEVRPLQVTVTYFQLRQDKGISRSSRRTAMFSAASTDVRRPMAIPGVPSKMRENCAFLAGNAAGTKTTSLVFEVDR